MSESCTLRVIWDPRFERYDFGPDHPFTEQSRRMCVRLLEELNFFPADDPVEPQLVASAPSATREELLRFHEEEYLRRVERAGGSRHGPPLDAGDTPSFPGCYEAAAEVVGGTLLGIRLLEESPTVHGFQPAGGLHHARPGGASGFCIFNDLAVGIRTFLAAGTARRRVAYIDIDVHHGDGVMYGFYEDGRVLDIDFHQDGRTIFPGTGYPSETGRGDGAGLKVNVPLPPEVGDEAFLPLFERIVPTMVRRHRPDLIVLQCGLDGHAGDRLGNLQYTPAAYVRAVDLVHQLAHEVAGGRLLVTGGGGYTPENVSRGLAQVALHLAGRSLPTSPDPPLPAPWRDEFQRLFRCPAPRGWRDGFAPAPTLWTVERGDRLLESLGTRLGVTWDESELTGRDSVAGQG